MPTPGADFADDFKLPEEWVAFDDVTGAMGALRFVPGSHRWGALCGKWFFETDLDRTRGGITLPDGAEWREAVQVKTFR